MSGNSSQRIRDISTSETWMMSALVKIARIPGLEPMLDMTVTEAWDWLAETLDERQAKVFTLRFGIADGVQRRLEETGAAMTPPITRERVRQIEAKALAKLRQAIDEKGGTAE